MKKLWYDNDRKREAIKRTNITMTKKEKRLLLWRILLGVLIVCNMAMVFLLSSQNSIKSADLSRKITIWVVKNFSKPQATTPAPETELTNPPDPPVTDPIEPPTTTPTEPPITDPVEPPTTDPVDPPVTDPIEPPVTEPIEPPVTEPEPTEPPVTEPEEPPVEETKPKDPMADLTDEEKASVAENHTPIRKLAHMLEFGSLGALVFLFLLSWQGRIWWRYLSALAFVFAYASADELHQKFSDGRAGLFSDVIIDFRGALIACTAVLVIAVAIRLIKQMIILRKKLVTTYYDISVLPNGKPLSIALVTDLHSCEHETLVDRLRDETPDMILLAGDIIEAKQLTDEHSSTYAFLRSCSAIAPTYYSLGNHEVIGANKKAKTCQENIFAEIRERIAQTGVTLLHNESVLVDGIRICGLTSGLTKKENRPNEEALAEFAKAPEFRILLCHHPEYYEPYIRKTDIDLIVCGHAHGGQWRFFGHGIFAPGQGILPKYTAGVIDNRCIISRGAGDHTFIPRILNPRELVIVHCESQTEKNDKIEKTEKNCTNQKKEN